MHMKVVVVVVVFWGGGIRPLENFVPHLEHFRRNFIKAKYKCIYTARSLLSAALTTNSQAGSCRHTHT